MVPTGVVPVGVVQLGAVLGGRYRLDELLGVGGMGQVFAARDLLLDRRVAVKLPTVASDGARERFRREARAAASLNHRNIVSVYDWGETADSPYLVMELIDGRSLRDALRERRVLPAREVAAFGLQIADALAHAHSRGVIHRDVKPTNLLVTSTGDIKVTDFGISKSTNSEALTQPGAVMGTPGYLAPEQAAGLNVDARTDVYALGVVLCELLTGTRDGTMDARAGVTELERVAARARAQDPAARYQHASDLRDVLQAVVRLLDAPVTSNAASVLTAPAAIAPTAVAPVAPAPPVPAPAPVPVPARASAPPPVPVLSKRRRWRVRHVLAMVSAPLVLAAGGAFAYYELTRPPSVQVPNVVDRDVFTAADTLQKAGFHVDSIVANNPRPGGVVLAQSPRRGRHVDEGSTVTITISDVRATIPDVVGADVDAALAELRHVGFVDLQLVDDYRDDVDPGTVVGTTPVPYVDASKAEPVQVVVARDPHVTVPNLEAVDRGTATQTLQQLGLVVAVKTASSRTVAAGLVMSASPSAGRVVVRGTTVTLTVSSGPKLVSVPYVVGWSADDAVDELEDAGFAVTITTATVPNGQVGDVVAENPPGGRSPEGGTVTITVGVRQGKGR